MGNTDSLIRSEEQSVDIKVKNTILKRLEFDGRTNTIEFVVKLCCVDHFLSRIRDNNLLNQIDKKKREKREKRLKRNNTKKSRALRAS